MNSKKVDIAKMMLNEYRSHLEGVISELSAYDSRGELIIGPGLKVVHKPSGYEYTIASIDEESPGHCQITLKNPDQPREEIVNPASLHPDLAGAVDPRAAKFVDEDDAADEEREEEEDDDDDDDGTDYGINAYQDFDKNPDEGESEGDTFVIDEKEFAKHYEEA